MKIIIKWILVLLCMLTIFFFSNDSADASTKKSDGLLIHISEVLVGRKLTNKEKQVRIDKYVKLIRKSAHFTLYLILGLLLINALSEHMTINYKCILISLLIAFLYACSDEIHQLFVPGRSCELLDIIIDSSGSYTGIMIYYLINKLWRRRYE